MKNVWDQEYYQRAEIRAEKVFEDSLERSRFAERFMSSQKSKEKSSWLMNEEIPAQAEIDMQIEDATRTLELKTLSKSQRTKRGKKFNEKAKRQAGMMNQLNIYNAAWSRASYAAINAGIKIEAKEAHEKGDVVNEGDFLDAGKVLLETSHLDSTGSMMTDISNYAVWKSFAKKKGDVVGGKEFLDKQPDFDYKDVTKLADKRTYMDQYEKLLKELEDLNLDDFNYKTDEEFTKSFAGRYVTLKAFSHTEDILKDPGLKNNISKEREKELLSKSLIIKEILSDYENRATMIQSPYYVLLAGKDIDGLSNEDLQARINRTKDDVAKSYLRNVLERRNYITFGKGMSAKDLEKKLVEISSKKSAQAKDIQKEAMEKDAALMEVRDGIMDEFRQRVSDVPEADRDLAALSAYADEKAEIFELELLNARPSEILKVKEVPFLDCYYDKANGVVEAITKMNKLLGINNLTTEIKQKDSPLLKAVPEDILAAYLKKNRELVGYANRFYAAAELNKWNADFKGLSKEEKAKREKIAAPINKYLDSFSKDEAYKRVCSDYIMMARQVQEALFTTVSKNFKFDSMGELAGTEIDTSPTTTDIRSLLKTMYGGLSWTHGYEMPEEVPETEAMECRKYFLEKRGTIEEKNKLSKIYKKNLETARRVRQYREKEEERHLKVKDEYGDITHEVVNGKEKVTDMRNEWTFMDNLNTKGLSQEEKVKKERDFIRACVSMKKDKERLSPENRDILLKGFDEMFERMETEMTDPATHEFKKREDFFKDEETYKRWCRDIDAGFNVQSALELYRSLGGVISDERYNRIYSIGAFYQNMQMYHTASVNMAMRPEAMFFSHKELDGMSLDDIYTLRKRVAKDLKNAKGKDKAVMMGRNEIANDLMFIYTYERQDLDFVNKKDYAERNNVKKEVKKDDKTVSTIYEKTEVRNKRNLTSKNSLEKALMSSKQVEESLAAEGREAIKNRLKNYENEPHFIVKDTDVTEYIGLVRFKYLNGTATRISDISNERGYKYGEMVGEESNTQAITGLLNQFRLADTRKYDKKDSNADEMKNPLSKQENWKQFGAIGTIPTSNAITIKGFAKAVYDTCDVLKLAKNLDAYIRTSSNPDTYMKTDEERQLYRDIMTYAEKMDGVLEALKSDDADEQALVREYLQNLRLLDDINREKLSNRWIMPAVGCSFNEYKAAKTKGKREELCKQFYEKIRETIEREGRAANEK